MKDSPLYTVQDYEVAKASLAAVEQRLADYTGNNPDKYRSALREAREHLRAVERCLKDSGVLPLSDRETLERELDRAFPNAGSRQVVEFEGVRYRRGFEPLEWSNSRKSVRQWRKWWERVE